MGKRQLGQMQPFELVLTLILADLATIPMAESAIPVLHGIVPLLTLVVLHFFLTLITRKSDFLNRIISGKPVIVINPDGIDYAALKQLNISLDDLFEAIRSCNFFSIDEVQYAIVETNGTVSVLPKKANSPLTIEDVKQTTINNKKIKIKKEETTIPITLVSEGTILKNNFRIANLDEGFLKYILNKTKTKKVKSILLLTIDGNGKIYFQLKNKKGEVFNSSYKKEIS
ncbi:MAG: DUF421 domain-containing protein [Clostridia bacterium]|nr:DUF421 domain-containing protein [Clostridia bacterium]